MHTKQKENNLKSNLKLTDLTTLFPGQDFFLDDMNEGYDEFKRADKGSKGVTAKDKGEKEVYGAGVEKGEKIVDDAIAYSKSLF